MLETVYNLLDEKGILNDFIHVPYRGDDIPAEIEFLVDELRKMDDSRISLHANRLMKADRSNSRQDLLLALQALGREVIRKTNIIKELGA